MNTEVNPNFLTAVALDNEFSEVIPNFVKVEIVDSNFSNMECGHDVSCDCSGS